MLIVEGPDMAGKTTFCAAIARILERDFEHPSGRLVRDKFGMDESRDMLAETCRRAAPWGVFDRGYVSEYAYGTAARRWSRVSPAHVDLIQGRFRPCVLIVTADDETYARWVAEKYAGREEEYDPETCAEVNRAYRAIAAGDPPGGFPPIHPDRLRHYAMAAGSPYPSSNDGLLTTVAGWYAERAGAKPRGA